MPEALRHIINVAAKEFIHIRRDRRLRVIVLLAPLLQLIVFGHASTFDLKETPVLVIDQDRTEQSRELAQRLDAAEYFKVVGELGSIEEAIPAFRAERSHVALAVPKGFGGRLTEGSGAEALLLFDGSNSNQATLASNYANVIASNMAMERALSGLRDMAISSPAFADLARMLDPVPGHGPSTGPIDLRPRVLFNPELKSINFMVPGVVAMIMMIMTMVATAISLAKEKELGTMEYLVVTPIKPYQLILGKLAPWVVISYLQITLVICLAVLWFGVSFKGSVALLYGIGGIFLVCSLGLGLLISTLSNNQQQAMMTSFMIMMPQVILSGYIFPISNMPEPIQWVTFAIPLRYFLVVTRSLFLKGVGLDVLWPQVAALATLGILYVSLASALFRKRA